MPTAASSKLHGDASTTLQFKLLGYFYALDGPANPSEALADYVSARLYHFWGPRNEPAWVVRPDKTPLAAAHLDSGKAFMPVEVTFSWERSAHDLALSESVQLKHDADKFDALFENLAGMLRSKQLKHEMGMEKSTLLCWSLSAPDRPISSNLSRWVLSAPENPVLLPAEKIEQILFSLVSVRIKLPETIHVPCGPRAVIGCIKFQLGAQKAAFSSLCHSLEDLRVGSQRDKIQMRCRIENNVTALEEVDAALATLVALFEKNIGKAPPIEGNWAVVSKVKEFIRGPFSAVAIDSDEVETLKANARKDLATLQRTAPVLAAHIRLHDSGRRAELLQACNTAAPGAERSDMLNKLSISASELRRPESRAAQLAWVRRHYQNTYTSLVVTLESLDKLVDAEYVSRGEALFNVRGMWGRFGRKIRGGRSTCLTEEESEREKSEKWDGRASMQSEVTWCEKVEPAWLV